MAHSFDELPWPTLLQRARRTVVVVDMVESVRLMEANEEDTVRRWQQFVGEVATHVLPSQHGRLVKSLGDGLLCEFPDVGNAVQSALQMQQLMTDLNDRHPTHEAMQLRIGAHTADVIVDQLDVYGSGVNLAARLMTLAEPGEIVVSSEVRDHLVPGLDAEVDDLGECYLKNLQQPVRAYRIGHAPEHPASDLPHLPMQDMRPTLAVIPWAARVADPLQHALGDLLADEVIASLSRCPDLYVVSRLSTSVFRDRAAALSDIRRLLGAGYVVSGSYQVVGQSLRMSVEVTETATARVVWADSLRDDIRAVLSGESELVSRIIEEVSGAILRRQLERARTEPLASLESYTLLMAAVSLMHRTAPADFERAHVMLEHLIERNRRHPVPHAWLAKWHVLRVQQGWSTDLKRDAALALDNTRRALDDDPHCSLALAIDGSVHCNLLKDFDTAAQRYELAVSVNPNESLAWLFTGTLHAFKGEGEAAVAAAERALKLSPLDPMRYFFESLAATAALSAGQHEKAIVLAKHSLRLNRTHTSTLRATAIAQVQLGRIDEARATVQALLALEPNLTVSKYLERSPSSAFATGKLWSDSLRAAGVPD
jgi:adenylate cyclase